MLRRAGSRRSLWLLRALLLVTLLVWFNQGSSVAEYEARRSRAARGAASLWERVQQPLAFAYRRSYDEELYFALSGAMLGKSVDDARVRAMRVDSGADFARALPPADGRWHAPYREVPLEYPPLLVPVLLVPRLLCDDFASYARLLSAGLGLCLWLAVELVGRAFRSARARNWVLGCAWLALLAHGSIAVQRLDALIALGLAATLWAWQRRRYGWLGVLLGLTASAKLLPALWLLPILSFDRALLPAWRQPAARRRVLRVLGAFAVAFSLPLLPLLLWDAGGQLWRYHAARGLHVESVAATLLVTFDAAALSPATLSFGSLNLAGERAAALAQLLPALLVLSWLGFCGWGARWARVRGASGRAALLVASALLVWLSAKVFSPQYLTWVIPLLGALGGGSRWCRPWLWALAALALSQLYLRGYFDAVYKLQPLGTGTLLLRDACLVVLLTLCVARLRAPPPARR